MSKHYYTKLERQRMKMDLEQTTKELEAFKAALDRETKNVAHQGEMLLRQAGTIETLQKIIDDLGSWASAAQEDPSCCAELKAIFLRVVNAGSRAGDDFIPLLAEEAFEKSISKFMQQAAIRNKNIVILHDHEYTEIYSFLPQPMVIGVIEQAKAILRYRAIKDWQRETNPKQQEQTNEPEL